MSQPAYRIDETPAHNLIPGLEREGTCGRPRVLVVDDDPLPRELISSYLEAKDFETVNVDSGEKAVAVLCDLEFDLVLSDMSMPGMSGMEVLDWIREHRPSVPVISDRPYRGAQSPHVARAEIARCGGKQLDPELVEIFLRIPQLELQELAHAAQFKHTENNDESFIQRRLAAMT
jgi:CheY-like chemotaxis protein